MYIHFGALHQNSYVFACGGLLFFIYIYFKKNQRLKERKMSQKPMLDIIMHYAFEEFYEELQMFVYSSQIR